MHGISNKFHVPNFKALNVALGGTIRALTRSALTARALGFASQHYVFVAVIYGAASH
jgi:hypothetical protein